MSVGKVLNHRMGEWEAFVAINNENKSLITPLLQQKKLDPNLGFRGTTLLTTAIHRNSSDIVKMLLEHGANPNKKSNENDRYEPPIITATRLKYLHLVTILMEHGADLTLTNFYGEDAVFQAVVANAFGILVYFLSTKPHGSCFHESEKVCPLQHAILDGENYPSKRKCFLICLKYHYTCSCSRLSNCFSPILMYKNKEVRWELLGWIYLAYGINLVPLVSNSGGESNQGNNVPPQLIKLTNLVRISIRSKISETSKRRRTPFCDSIAKLPLPLSLIKFLMMNDELPI